MLSYRHAFHAGNHADVLKHCVLVLLLRYLNAKDKPYWVVDSHAGAGSYALDSGYALHNREFDDGIARLWTRSDLPPALADYVALVRAFNDNGKLRRYPGSPWFALRLMRAADRLRLFELHGSDVRLLGDDLARHFEQAAERTAIVHGDGFAALKSVLPPPSRRGLVLVDPAYEDKRDYRRVPAALREGLERFATGTYAVWYPRLPRGEPLQLVERLKKLPVEDWLHASLAVQAPASHGFGLYGSGLFVINPPWTLAAALRETLPYLAAVLGRDAGAGWSVETSDGAAPARR